MLAMDNQPDVALVDINLEGGREGIEVARWLRKTCEAPIVFITGYTDCATVERIHEQVPGAPVLSKPLYQGRLANAVTAVIAHQHSTSRAPFLTLLWQRGTAEGEAAVPSYHRIPNPNGPPFVIRIWPMRSNITKGECIMKKFLLAFVTLAFATAFAAPTFAAISSAKTKFSVVDPTPLPRKGFWTRPCGLPPAGRIAMLSN